VANKALEAIGAFLKPVSRARKAADAEEAPDAGAGRDSRDPPDFELKKYELDREHELELNKIAHALEIERLKVLQLLNGGAFTVLAAFAPGLLRSHGLSRPLALLAAASWVVGLGAASWATQKQLDAQGKFNKAYRCRRNAVELRRLSTTFGEEAASRMVPPAEGQSHADDADDAFKEGGRLGNKLWKLALASLFLFGLGAALLAASLGFADPAQLTASERAK